MKHIVSFDLDMTLLDHKDYQIPDSTMKALDILREQYYIVVATGRDMDNHFSEHFRDLIAPDAIVHLNGTKVTVGKQMIFEHKMDKKQLEQMLVFAQEHQYSIGATIGNDDFYTHPEQVAKMDEQRWGESGRQFKDPWELMEIDVRTLAYIGRPEGAQAMERIFPAMKFLLFAGETGADIVDQQVSKAKGLEILCSYFGTNLKSTYAFGDSMNDYEMIREVGTGIAMGNAIDPLKRIADYVTSTIDCDGIWNACKHFRLID